VKINTSKKNGFDVIKITGSVERESEYLLSDAINNLLNNKSKKIMIDLSECHYMPSSTLAMFITAHKYLEAVNGRFTLIGVGSGVKSLLKKVNLYSIFDICKDIDKDIEY